MTNERHIAGRLAIRPCSFVIPRSLVIASLVIHWSLGSWSLVICPVHWSFPRLVPIRNIIVASRPSIRSHRHEIVGRRIMFAGALINVGMTPRVQRYLAFQIRPAPTLGIAWLLHEIVQAVFAFGIISIIDL